MDRGKPKKYPALAEQICRLIAKGRLQQGASLPSEKRMASIFKANHLTIRKALKVLETRGLIYKIPSRGNFVGKRPSKHKRSNLIGVLFPDKELFFYDILSELEAKMHLFGFHPVVNITLGSQEKEKNALEFFDNINVDGIIAAPNRACVPIYQQIGIPTVFFDVFLETVLVPYVIVDDKGGAQRAVEHLLGLNHRRIAHIGGMGDETCQQRLQGYVSALERNRITVDKDYIKQRDYSRQWGYYAAQELFEKQKPPTAVFCGNDTIAAGTLRFLRSHSIDCPREVSVIGFGNIALAEDIDLSTVTQSSRRIANAVWENIRMLLEGDTPVMETKIATELVIRNTTALFRSSQ